MSTAELPQALPVGAPSTRLAIARRLTQSTDGRIGLFAASLLLLASVCAATGLLPVDPLEQHAKDALTGPSSTYWLGTDQFGRDVFSRTLDGVAVTLKVVVLGVAAATVVGSTAGIVSGFVSGRLGSAIMRLTDILFAFPAILLALVIVTALGRGMTNAALAIAVVYTPQFVRVARGPVLALRHAEFVDAGRVLGFSRARLLAVHVLPNALPVILVQVTLALSTAILVESSLSFLGLGTQPPQASLGLMVNDARAFASFAPWTMAAPAAALIVAVCAFNLLGDALRDALDRRTMT